MKPIARENQVELDLEELETRLDQIEERMGEAYSRPFRLLLGSYQSLLRLVQEKNISIHRLRQLLFGSPTERIEDAVPREPAIPAGGG